MDLPPAIAAGIQPLQERLPLARAMGRLVVDDADAGIDTEYLELVAAILEQAPFAKQPALQAGLWLYVDALGRSHRISQGIVDASGAFWHGIMHRREGDFNNSHYWFHRVGKHPAMEGIAGYEPHAFIEAVERRTADQESALAATQREEWAALFSWCAHHG